MLSVLAALTLAQAAASPSSPDVAVVVVVREGALSPELVARLTAASRTALAKTQLDVQPEAQTRTLLGSQDPVACQTNVTCFGLLGRALNAPVLVRVEGSAVETDLAVFVQAVDTRTLEVVAQQSLVTQTNATRESLAGQLAPFAAEVRQRVPRREAQAQAKPSVEQPPREEAPPEESTREEPAQASEAQASGQPAATALTREERPLRFAGRPAWPLVPAGIGVAVAAVGGAFVMQAHSDNALLTTPDPDAPQLPADERERIAARGDNAQRVGWSLVGVGAAALGAGLALYLAGEPVEEDVAVSALIGPNGVAVGGTF